MSRPGFNAWIKDRFFLVACVSAPPVWLLIYFTSILPLPGRGFTPGQLLLLGLLLPLLEELAFRGLLQGWLGCESSRCPRHW